MLANLFDNKISNKTPNSVCFVRIMIIIVMLTIE